MLNLTEEQIAKMSSEDIRMIADAMMMKEWMEIRQFIETADWHQLTVRTGEFFMKILVTQCKADSGKMLKLMGAFTASCLKQCVAVEDLFKSMTKGGEANDEAEKGDAPPGTHVERPDQGL